MWDGLDGMKISVGTSYIWERAPLCGANNKDELALKLKNKNDQIFSRADIEVNLSDNDADYELTLFIIYIIHIIFNLYKIYIIHIIFNLYKIYIIYIIFNLYNLYNLSDDDADHELTLFIYCICIEPQIML